MRSLSSVATMLLLLLVLTVLAGTCNSFMIQPQLQKHVGMVVGNSPHHYLSKDVNHEIAQELQELQGDNENQHSKHKRHHNIAHKATPPAAPEGFNTYHESLVHKLRHELYEKDRRLQETLNELETALLQSTTALEIATVTENLYEREHHLYQHEHESVRLLLWQAIKLMGRRLRRVVRWVWPFGKKK